MLTRLVAVVLAEHDAECMSMPPVLSPSGALPAPTADFHVDPSIRSRSSSPDPYMHAKLVQQRSDHSEPPTPTNSSSTTLRTMLRTEAARTEWSAPPEQHPEVRSLLRALSAGERRPVQLRGRPSCERMQEVDSGVRLCSHDTLPPPYTAD